MNTCPHCAAQRVPGPDCPSCGVVYAKAEARQRAAQPAPGRELLVAVPPAVDAPPSSLTDEQFELRVRTLAIPLALTSGFLVAQSTMLNRLSSLVSTMWLHEGGHMFAAWLCGYWAVALPWVTWHGDTRSPSWSLLVLGGIVLLGVRGWAARSVPLLSLAGVLLALQAVGTLGLRPETARLVVVFNGEGGALINGTLLMLTVYARRDGQLRTGGLCWGFLVLGALGFTSVFTHWWTARHDIDVIGFGVQEGVGPSDPSKLVDQFHWTIPELVDRYLGLGFACLTALAIAYVIGIMRQRRRLARGGLASGV